MKKKLLRTSFFIVLCCVYTYTLYAQTYSELFELTQTSQVYLANSAATESQKMLLQLELTAAQNLNGNSSSSSIITAYQNLLTALKMYVKVAQPINGTSFDMTFFMQNPSLTTTGTNWSITPVINNNCAELYYKTFDLYQTLEDMPEGIYTMTVTGFYRNSMYHNGILSEPNAGCYLYGNDEQVPLLTLYYNSNAAMFNWNIPYGRYANSMADAEQAFNAGFYADNEVKFIHGTDSDMRLGLRNIANNNGNWSCFRDFKLYYWGSTGVAGAVYKFRVACAAYSNGGAMIPGSVVSQQTPVYYQTNATADASSFWYFLEIKENQYAIQNASTKQYITWDGERIGEYKRYIKLTDVMYGDSSLWTLNLENGSNYCIRNVKTPNELFDTRANSYVVGTYDNAGTPANNQLYQFYDMDGDLITSLNTRPFKAGMAELMLNGKKVPYDSATDLYLYSVPITSMNNGVLSALIQPTYKEGWKGLKIDGNVVDVNQPYLFEGITAGKEYKLYIVNNQGKEAEATLTFTGMPIVQIIGNFSPEYSAATIMVNEADKPIAELINARIKWRGASTLFRNKKQYAIKLYDDAGQSLDRSFFGLRNDNNWILDGMSIDVARMRNRVATDLWNAYGTLPYYAHAEPEVLTGTRGNFVELFLNNEYVGIYCMTEKMDRKQMKLRKLNESTNAIRGELWKSSEWSYSVLMGTPSDRHNYPLGTSPIMYNNNSETWDSYEVKYPDLGDGEPISWETLYNAVNFVCTTSDDQFESLAHTYFDLPVLLDYYILMETILSADNHGKNMYFFTYNRLQDKKISFGVWDLDATCGRQWASRTVDPNQDYSNYILYNEHGDYNLFKRIKECNVNNFNDSVRFRYRDLRKTTLHTDSIIKRFQDYKDLFDISGASVREVQRWNNTDAGWLDFDAEMRYLDEWFHNRMAYIDNMWDIENLPVLNTLQNTEKYNINLKLWQEGNTLCVKVPSSMYLKIVTPAGQLVFSGYVNAGNVRIDNLNKGIYVVNKQKAIIL